MFAALLPAFVYGNDFFDLPFPTDGIKHSVFLGFRKIKKLYMATRFAAAAAIGALVGGIDLCSKPDPWPVPVFVCSWCYFYVTLRANPLFLLHLCLV